MDQKGMKKHDAAQIVKGLEVSPNQPTTFVCQNPKEAPELIKLSVTNVVEVEGYPSLVSQLLHFSWFICLFQTNMSRHPEIKWAQRVDKVYITVQLPGSKNAKVDLTPDGIFTFSACAGAEDRQYELKLELFDKVNVEESKINIGVRSIFCVVQKAAKGWWKRLLSGEGKPPHYVKVDWDKWVDEDEDNGLGDLDLGGMDFSKFGGMGDDFDDSDDEVSKPEAQETNIEKEGEHDAGKSKSEASTENPEAAPKA